MEKLQKEQKEVYRALVIDWCNQGKGYSQAQLATKVETNESYISQIINGTYSDKHPSDEVWLKVARFFKVDMHIDSYNYRAIIGACKRAQAEQICWGIDGYSGAGKTYALARYAQSTPNAYHIICRDSMSIRDFMEEVAVAVGASPKGSRYQIEQAIVNKLAGRKALLMFDEVEYLKPACLHNIKTLHDLLVKKGQAGIIISGCGIHDNLTKLKKRGQKGMPQFYRRFDQRWISMDSISKKEIKQACEMSGITDAKVLTWFYAKVENYDSLSILIKDALRVANDEPVTLQMCIDYLQN